jgi:ABC-type polysaccharide/polyol phosphate export permease
LNNIASDAAVTVNYAASFLLLLTPVIYPFSMIPGHWQWVFLLNPLVPAFEMWRWALLGMPPPPSWSIALAFTITSALFIAGLLFFQRWEQTILDKS